MNFGITTKLIATTFALCGFAVAILSGLAAGNSSTQVLGTALICMIICQAAGLGVGVIGERIVTEHIGQYKKAHTATLESADVAAPARTSPPDLQNS